MGFLGIGSTKKKRAAQAASATATAAMADKLISSGASLSGYAQQSLLYSSDGKISAKEKKLLKQFERQEEKTVRTTGRQKASIEKVALRSSARKSAYENGIDPMKWIGDSVGSLANGVVGVSNANAFGKVGSAFAGRTPQAGQNSISMSDLDDLKDRLSAGIGASPYSGILPGDESQVRGFSGEPPKDNKNMMILAALGVGALLLFSKKR